MIQLIDLSNWKTKKEIINEYAEKGIDIDERKWRVLVEQHNKAYCMDLEETYIVMVRKAIRLRKIGKKS